MTATCKVCGSEFRGVDRDEDGVLEVPEQQRCAAPGCDTFLCRAGCEHVGFTCDGCLGRFCDAHAMIRLDNDKFCAECYHAIVDEETGCTMPEIEAIPVARAAVAAAVAPVEVA